jgi:hypothetical protein
MLFPVDALQPTCIGRAGWNLPISFSKRKAGPSLEAGIKIVGISYAWFASCNGRFRRILRKPTNLTISSDAAVRRKTLHSLLSWFDNRHDRAKFSSKQVTCN